MLTDQRRKMLRSLAVNSTASPAYLLRQYVSMVRSQTFDQYDGGPEGSVPVSATENALKIRPGTLTDEQFAELSEITGLAAEVFK